VDGDCIVRVACLVVTYETAVDFEVGVEARGMCNGDCSSGAPQFIVTSERAATLDVEAVGLCEVEGLGPETTADLVSSSSLGDFGGDGSSGLLLISWSGCSSCRKGSTRY